MCLKGFKFAFIQNREFLNNFVESLPQSEAEFAKNYDYLKKMLNFLDEF